MMRKFLICALLALPVLGYSQTAAEEAIILNQELQFLEDSVNNVQSAALDINSSTPIKTPVQNDSESLEKTYFEDVEEDAVSTRTASPKRRSF